MACVGSLVLKFTRTADFNVIQRSLGQARRCLAGGGGAYIISAWILSFILGGGAMDDLRQNASLLTPTDTTLDPPVELQVERRPAGLRRVEFLEGSSPELSLETQSLLQARLRSAALVLCVGSEAFLLKRALIDRVEEGVDATLAFDDHILFVLHVANVLGLAL